MKLNVESIKLVNHVEKARVLMLSFGGNDRSGGMQAAVCHLPSHLT